MPVTESVSATISEDPATLSAEKENTGASSEKYTDPFSGAGDKTEEGSAASVSETHRNDPVSGEDRPAENTEEEGNMAATLLYQGHASIRIVTGEGKVIYIDPFMGDGYDMAADLILMTHGHYDHTQDKLIKKRNEDCTVITWKEALVKGEYVDTDLGYVSVEPVEAGYNKNHKATECVGFVLTFSDGIKAYFSGDTSTTPSMGDLADKEIDYAFICCDGVYNMDVTEASECAKLIKAKHTIPYHMAPANKNGGFDQSTADSFDATGKIILKPGEELVLD